MRACGRSDAEHRGYAGAEQEVLQSSATDHATASARFSDAIHELLSNGVASAGNPVFHQLVVVGERTIAAHDAVHAIDKCLLDRPPATIERGGVVTDGGIRQARGDQALLDHLNGACVVGY